MIDVYVKDGKEIQGDSWVVYVLSVGGHEVQTQPMNMTTEQMSDAGVTVVQQDPIPDTFYGPVTKDPDNPGKWIQTLYTPEELKPKLKDHSATARYNKEVGGTIIDSYQHATDRITQSQFDAARMHAQNNAGFSFSWKSPTGFVQLGTSQLEHISNEIVSHVEKCFTLERDCHVEIDAGRITTKEQIDSWFA